MTPPCGKRVAALVFITALAGCGGGGSSDTTSGTTPSGVPAAGTASLTTPESGKTPWNTATAAAFTLRDASGAAVSGALSCTSDSSDALEVSADCSSVTGRRVGTYSVTVAGAGGVSAKASVKVIPPPHPLATHGPASSFGSGQYNLVVTPDGRVLAWGGNPGGVLGQGQTSTELVSLALPTAVKDSTGQGVLTGIVAASAGNTSALALSEEGEVYSWGWGQALGRTAVNGDPLPKKVLDPAGTASFKGVVAAMVGDDNAVALADDGTVYSWGYYSGRAGADPKPVPGIVSVGGKAVAVSAGSNWSAALLADGRIVTWGYGSDGRQGQPGVSTPAAPGFVIEQATGQPLGGIVAISAGYNFGLALSASGQLYAWGSNSRGQLGQGTSNDLVAGAVAVKGPGGAAPFGNIVMAAAGGNHALALDSTGKVWSWGYSQNGELGDGVAHPRVNSSALPDAVVSPAGTLQLGNVVSIAAGYSHSLALGDDGRLWIWGSGFRGNLGQGGTASSNTYVPLAVKDEAGTASMSLAPLDAWPNLTQRAFP
jgi:hypothetical protein